MRDLAGGRVTRRDMRREATKAAVLEAAEKVFLSQGYEGATIKAIADEAGVSPGTVLNAEPSKAALLMAILSNEVEIIAESVEQMEAALSGGLADRIIALLQIMLEAQSRNSELFAAAVGHSWMVATPPIKLHLTRWSSPGGLSVASLNQGSPLVSCDRMSARTRLSLSSAISSWARCAPSAAANMKSVPWCLSRSAVSYTHL